jgi:opacity protein-like surface antigen
MASLSEARSFSPLGQRRSGLPGLFVPTAASFSSNKTGWTIGGGVETKLWGGWSAKLEYLYVGLGTLTDSFGAGVNPVFLRFPRLAVRFPSSSTTSRPAPVA